MSSKKISAQALRKIVEQVVLEKSRKNRKTTKKASPHKLKLAEGLIKAKLLIEQEEGGSEEAAKEAASVSGMDASTDINAVDANDLADALFSGEDNDLYSAVRSATGWADGALGGAGAADAAGMKTVAIKVFGGGDEEAARANFIQRVGDVNDALSASEGFEKAEMPALEGADVNALQDALNSQSGDLGVDAESSYKDDEANFETWFASQDEEAADEDEPAADEEDSKVQAAGHKRTGNVVLERWSKLAGLNLVNEINDDERFPFPGPASVMDGAPNLGAGGAPDPSAIKGKAKAFLTKGKGTDGDSFAIQQNGTLGSSEMKPTQTNIKAGKSILFALIDAGADMEGAFATTDGEILDGHHRWSGQYLAHGGSVSHTNVHLIDKGGMSTPEFLTMLTVVGNALGRPTKLK